MLPRFLRNAFNSVPYLPFTSLLHLFSCLSYYLPLYLSLLHYSFSFLFLSLSIFLTLSSSLFLSFFFFPSLFLHLVFSFLLPFICSRSLLLSSLLSPLPLVSSLSRRLSLSLSWFCDKVSDSTNRHCLLPHNRFRNIHVFWKSQKFLRKRSQDIRSLTFQI